MHKKKYKLPRKLYSNNLIYEIIDSSAENAKRVKKIEFFFVFKIIL